MVSPYHTTGFYYAPFTKGLTGTLVLSSVAFIYPLNHHSHLFRSTYDSLFQEKNIVKFLLSKLVFLDPKDILCAGILLYHFRIFERRYGSRKFASYILSTFSISLLLEVAALRLAHHFDLKLDPVPTGPVAMVFSFFVPYFYDIPRVAMTHMLGIPITGKSLTYILGLQMCSTSLESSLLMGIGMLSGLIHRWLRLGQYIRIPAAVGHLCHSALGRFIASPPPKDLQRPIGATLEIQRQQQVELLERQMTWAQLQPRRNGGPFGFVGLFQNQNNVAQNVEQVRHPEPTDDQIQQLIDMGFQRERVMGALEATNNDITMAINMLLHQP